MSAAARVFGRMTSRDFITWNPGDGLRYELVDGEPRAMAPPSTVHGLLQSELVRLIGNHLRVRRPHCRVVANPGVIPRLLSAHNFRIPDLGVTGAPITPGQAALPEPILLAEILSPSKQSDTWSNVRAYTSIPGLREILVLHSTRVGAELLRRNDAGEWPREPAELRGGDVVLESVDFCVELNELYAGTGLTD